MVMVIWDVAATDTITDGVGAGAITTVGVIAINRTQRLLLDAGRMGRKVGPSGGLFSKVQLIEVAKYEVRKPLMTCIPIGSI